LELLRDGPETPEGASGVIVPLLLAHSTALSGHLVSSINPRLLLLFFSNHAYVTFQRGVQQIEIAARTRTTDEFNFYLLRFTQSCSERPGGCVPGELYSPLIERDWTGYEIQDAEELKNTASDCRQCHQRGRASAILLMRELEPPWTHFIDPPWVTEPRPGFPGVVGSDLIEDYIAVKGSEAYGTLDMTYLPRNAGALLQAVVEPEQPVLFPSQIIESERWPMDMDGKYRETPLRSAAWDSAYEAFKRGEQLALPYFETRVADPGKLARLARAYTEYREGTRDVMSLPDLADIFPDDPRVRAQIGLQTEPDAAPVDALIQACAGCHNDVLDQTISRARFTVDLARLDRTALERAIERIERPQAAPGSMPPAGARQPDAQTRERLVAYLREAARSGPTPEPALARAAELGGMARPAL